MTSSSIVWFSVDRGNVATALLGTQEASSKVRAPASQISEPTASGDIVLGFTNGVGDALAPAVAVVDKQRAEDLFAWLATYSPDVFPLSQYVRVLDTDEWLQTGKVPARTRLEADPIWPSLILGELLAQGATPDLRLTSLPLSRVPLCRSYTQARASALYRSNPVALVLVADRMELLEKAERQWRNVNTGVLRATWALAEDAFTLDPFTRDLVSLLSWSFERQRDSRGAMPQLPEELRAVSLDLRKLASGPLEYRVEEFERVMSILLPQAAAKADQLQVRLPAIFAALALWVGSGTSHISLLAEVSSSMPATYAWFGAFAGVLGQGSWHPEWARTTAAISKLLRGGFDIASTSAADLSWTEFAWLASVGQFELLSGMPRASAKVLSVDVLPGASAPFRLAADDGHGSSVDAVNDERSAQKRVSRPIVERPALATSEASGVQKDLASEMTFSNQQFEELSAAARALSNLFEEIKRAPPMSAEGRFELKPPPVSAKSTSSTNRKTVKRSTIRK
ncbi:hypothetical protein LMG28138_05508 [Pararobbsia alpina]|uniref:Uncharacterized protein n=1 Tax=Pararobbsia alpina TaxID=621374 RepID=A0A6S7BLA1_9BURK|nr:hypothetical protein LMG28138_05508 [Pararobbsia alpina]